MSPQQSSVYVGDSFYVWLTDLPCRSDRRVFYLPCGYLVIHVGNVFTPVSISARELYEGNLSLHLRNSGRFLCRLDVMEFIMAVFCNG